MDAAGRQAPVGEQPNQPAPGNVAADAVVRKDAEPDTGQHAGLHAGGLVAADDRVEFGQHRLAVLRKQPLADAAQLGVADPGQRLRQPWAGICRQPGCKLRACHDELLQGPQPPRQVGGIGEPADADAEIDLFVDEIAHRVVEDRLNTHSWILPEVGGDGRRHDHLAIVERRGQPQHPGRPGRALRDVAIGGLGLAQDDRRPVIEQAPLLRRRDAPRRATQQRRAQFLLELADLMADHRLGDTEPIGRGGERTGFDHGGEIDEAVEVQKVGHRQLSDLIRQFV